MSPPQPQLQARARVRNDVHVEKSLQSWKEGSIPCNRRDISAFTAVLPALDYKVMVGSFRPAIHGLVFFVQPASWTKKKQHISLCTHLRPSRCPFVLGQWDSSTIRIHWSALWPIGYMQGYRDQNLCGSCWTGHISIHVWSTLGEDNSVPIWRVKVYARKWTQNHSSYC